MKQSASIAIVLMAIVATAFARTDIFWDKVDQAKHNGQPRTAIESLDTILSETRQQNLFGEWMRALSEKITLECTIQGNHPEEKVRRLQSELANADSTTRPLMQSILAQWYWHYYDRNRWRFMDRTQTRNMNDTDFTTWDLRKLFTEIDYLYQDILLHKDKFAGISVSSFNDFLERGNTPEIYRPTLYDFLAQEAINFYATAEQMMAKPEDAYEIDAASDAMARAGRFMAFEPPTTDTGSAKYKALRLYRSLMEFHSRTGNTLALIDVDIQRLFYVYNNSFGPNRSRDYIQRMGDIAYRYRKYSQSSLALYYAARAYGDDGDLANAYVLASKGYQRFPESPGGQWCFTYMCELTQKQLQIVGEKSIPPGPGKITVTYKNFNKLYFRIYRERWDRFLEERDVSPLYISDSEAREVLQGSPLLEWSCDLERTTDLQARSVELPLPELKQGFYRIFASWQPDFRTSSMVQHTWFWVSSLALVSRQAGGRVQGLVLDDITGEPRKGVTVTPIIEKRHRTYERWWYRFSKEHHGDYDIWQEYKKGARRRSDANGLADFGFPKWQAMLLATTTDDTLLNYTDCHGYRNRPTKGEQTFLFTDRSLYRPGQTIIFKGICVRGDWASGDYGVMPRNDVVVEFHDANDKVIAADTVTTNDFGSFSGTFTAPNDRLTGVMRLQAIGTFGNAEFRVEEYKRPKFQVDLAKPRGASRVNDLITVKGSAVNYNGAPVDGAQVQFRVKRTMRYPHWWLWFNWWVAPSKEQEIAHGIVRTNGRGGFEIKFMALPDPMISPKTDPVFSYAVTADVTAGDGETRSSTVMLTVGYKALTATMDADSMLQHNQPFPLIVATTTLDSIKRPASGTVKIIRLRQPAAPVSPRSWEGSYFKVPNFVDTAAFGTKWPGWPADTTVAELQFATSAEAADTLRLCLPSGLYRAECVTRDSFGSEVKSLLPLMVLPDTGDRAFGLKLPSVALVSSKTIKVGRNLLVRWGTGYGRGRCLVEVLRDNMVLRRYWTDSAITQHAFTLPVAEIDRGGFLVNLTYFRANRCFIQSFPISVPWDNKNISVTLETFRSSLQPGEQQSIVLRLHGENAPLDAAEVLAGMYDQSLDQFYGHRWPTLNIFRHDRSGIIVWPCNGPQGYSILGAPGWNGDYEYQPISYISFPAYVIENLFYYQFNYQPSRNPHPADTSESDLTTGKLAGSVVNAETKEPLAGAVVSVPGTFLWDAATDVDGRYRIVKVPRGDYGLKVRRVGYESQSSGRIHAIPGLTTVTNFALRPQGNRTDRSAIIPSSPSSIIPGITRGILPMSPSRLASYYPSYGNASTAIGQTAGVVSVRGGRSDEMCYFIDNVSVNDPLNGMMGAQINTAAITEVMVITGGFNTEYGEAMSGAVNVVTKPGAQPPAAFDLRGINVRKNLSETAFFYPHLLMDDSGRVKIEATMPEALTRWRFMAFAHGKELQNGYTTAMAITQKRLMVQPNAPRFLREGDTIEFAAKVTNLADSAQTGLVQLNLRDLATDQPRDSALGLAQRTQQFALAAKASQAFSWRLIVPQGTGPLAYTVAAKSEQYSDGEEGTMPVLSSRVLLTESVPLWISKPGTKAFQFDRLRQIGTSSTFARHRLTVQMTSNPAWYAIQALPYLIEFPYECSEQIFERYYANSLASHIATSSPRIRKVFDRWKGTDALKSNLEKNQSLKSVLLEETPWVLDAERETDAKKRVGLLFGSGQMEHGQSRALRKLEDMQLNSGGWPWFPDGYADPYITLYITTGFARLHNLGVPVDLKLTRRSLAFLDAWIKKIYDDIGDREKNHLTPLICYYLYGRSFYMSSDPLPSEYQVVVDYFLGQGEKYWLDVNSRMSQGYLAVAANRWGKNELARKIMSSIKERSVTDEELGRFWREDELSLWWYRAPIETQALMIEAFDEVTKDTTAIEECKIWLLKQKQTQDWKTTTATADAIYALLLKGEDLLSSTKLVEVALGGMTVQPEKTEVGTGFYEKIYTGEQIKPEYSAITITKSDKGIAWGGVHFQYFEDIGKVTSHATDLSLEKKLFVNRDTKQGKTIEPVNGTLAAGDLVTVRIVLRTDRDMEYVHMKDLRGSGMEPVNVLSQYKYQDGLRYYESTKDVATHFFIDYLPKGTYVFEYQLRVQLKGRYQCGQAEIQCMYAPEFNSHSGSTWVEVK